MTLNGADNSNQTRTNWNSSWICKLGLWLLGCYCLIHLAGLAEGYVFGKHVYYLVSDDSMITFRVAYNIAHGMGPYFNSSEHIAANTSLFWPYLLSPLFRVTALPYAVLKASVFSLFLSTIILALISVGASTVRKAAFGLGTILFIPTLAIYAPTAWEHIPQTIFTTAAFMTLLGRPIDFGHRSLPLALVLMDMAFILRPDALPMILLLAALVFIGLRRPPRMFSVVSLAITFIFVAGYFGFHYCMYGDFFPNTYYLKVNTGAASIKAGIHYVAFRVLSVASPLVILACALAWLGNRKQWTKGESLALLLLVAQTSYIIWVGGDAFPGGRFFLLILPAAILLFWEKIDFSSFRGRSLSRVCSAVAVLIVAAGLFCNTMNQRWERAFVQQELFGTGKVQAPEEHVRLHEDRVGQLESISIIQEHLRPEDGRIGVFYLGALSYYLPEYRIADFLGKADSAIAHGPVKWGPAGHNKWNIDFTLQNRDIAVIPFHKPNPEEEDRLMLKNRVPFAFDADLDMNPYLKSHYTWLSPEELGGGDGLYVRNDLVSKFRKN